MQIKSMNDKPPVAGQMSDADAAPLGKVMTEMPELIG